MTAYWWDRAGRSPVGELEAVIVSLDSALADGRNADALGDLVWNLHCSGVRVAVITSARGSVVQRSIRDLLGDGAVELMLTGDEVGTPRPDPEVYHLALWELGVLAENTLAVEDSASGIRAAAAAGLAAVMANDTLSVWRCRRLRERRDHRVAATPSAAQA